MQLAHAELFHQLEMMTAKIGKEVQRHPINLYGKGVLSWLGRGWKIVDLDMFKDRSGPLIKALKRSNVGWRLRSK